MFDQAIDTLEMWILWKLLYPGYTLRTPQYRFTEWVNLLDADLETQQPDWGNFRDWGELYDLFVDPNETNNLYRNDEWLETKLMLRNILQNGWFEHNWIYNEESINKVPTFHTFHDYVIVL